MSFHFIIRNEIISISFGTTFPRDTRNTIFVVSTVIIIRIIGLYTNVTIVGFGRHAGSSDPSKALYLAHTIKETKPDILLRRVRDFQGDAFDNMRAHAPDTISRAAGTTCPRT